MNLGDLSLLLLAGCLVLFVVAVFGIVFDMRSKAIGFLLWCVQTLFLVAIFATFLNAVVFVLNIGG